MEEILGLAESMGLLSSTWVKVAGIARDVVVELVKSGAKAEQQRVALQQTLGRANGAVAYLDIRHDASSLPFEIDAIFNANKALINTGLSAARARRDVNNLAKAIAAAGGDSKDLERLSLVLQDVYDRGAAGKEQLREFAAAGVDINKLLAKSGSGKSNARSGKRIGYDQISQALNGRGENGETSYNALNAYSETTAGKVQQLKNNWDIFTSGIGEALLPVADETLDIANNTLKWMDISKTAPEVLQNEQVNMQVLAGSIMNLNEGNDTRARLIDELKFKYPELFANLDKEKTKNAELAKMLSNANDEYDRRIQLSKVDHKRQVLMDDIGNYSQIARNAHMQAEYDREHPDRGYWERYKYLGVADRYKLTNNKWSWMTMAGLLQPFWQKTDPKTLDATGNEADEYVKNLQAKADAAKILERKLALNDMVKQASDISMNPARQKLVWGDRATGNNKKMTALFREWNNARQLSHNTWSDDLLYGPYYDKFNALLKPVKRATAVEGNDDPANGGSYHNGLSNNTSDNITSGGSRNITINISKFFDNMNLTAQTMQQGFENLEYEVEKIFLRIVNSANTVNTKP